MRLLLNNEELRIKSFMLTKIKIKLSRQEYEVIAAITGYVAGMVDVVDVFTLLSKEALENINALFQSKRFKLQNSYTFSFTLASLYVFMDFIGTMMRNTGVYEKALYDLIYTNQIIPQVGRAIQMRMSFK